MEAFGGACDYAARWRLRASPGPGLRHTCRVRAQSHGVSARRVRHVLHLRLREDKLPMQVPRYSICHSEWSAAESRNLRLPILQLDVLRYSSSIVTLSLVYMQI